jgi:hypothetical protein
MEAKSVRHLPQERSVRATTLHVDQIASMELGQRGQSGLIARRLAKAAIRPGSDKLLLLQTTAASLLLE